MVQVAEGIPASSGGVPIPVEDYAHDSKGNRVSRTAKSGGAVETYAYDSQNRLVGYANPTTTATYAYDALDRRVAKTVDGAVTSYVYDTSMEDPLAFDDITLEFDSTASPILKRRWVHSDAVDEPVGFEAYTVSSGVGSGTEHTMFADRQGSVIWITEPATGQVVAVDPDVLCNCSFSLRLVDLLL